jgi:hypothetical protein
MFNPVGRVIAAVFIGAFVLTQAAVTSAWTPTTDRINVATFGGTINSIAVDVAGNIYTTGFFSGTADFDPGAANVNLTSAGGTDAFVSKLNSQGELEWAYRLGGTGADAGWSITVDTASNVYIGGYFSATVDFDPSAAIVNLVSAGSDEAFIWKLNSLGELVWARQVAGVGMSAVNAVAVDSAGFVLATGGFAGIADFDPGASSDVRLAKLVAFFKIMQVDGVGEGVLAKLIAGGYEDLQSILHLTPDRIAQLEGFQLRSATNIYNAIHKMLDKPQLLLQSYLKQIPMVMFLKQYS